MLDQPWWVYAAIVAWSVLLDGTALLAASKTIRFVFTQTGFAFLSMRSVAAVIAGILLPAVLSEDLGLADNEPLLIFAAPIVSLAIIDLILGRVAEPGALRFDFPGLISNLRDQAIADARIAAAEALYRSDLRLISRLSELYTSAELWDHMANLLHTKLTSLKEAKARLMLLLDGASDIEAVRRREAATEITKIDRTFARNLAGARREAIPPGGAGTSPG